MVRGLDSGASTLGFKPRPGTLCCALQGGVEIFLVASCYGNRDKLRPDGPLGSYADCTVHV